MENKRIYKYNPIEDCYATKKKIHIFRDEIEKRRLKKKYLTILDFGCGNIEDCGKYLLNRKDFYLGFDIHKESLEYAKKKYKTKKINFTEKIPNKKFDIIIISEVLEHLHKPEEILVELKNKLRKDGVILGSIPNGYGLTEIEKFIIHKFFIYDFLKILYSFFKKKKVKSKHIPFNYESGHIQFFTLSRFKRMIKKCNLKIYEIRNGTIMGADISGSTFLKFESTKKINTKIADFIPHFMSATWIFKLIKND